MELCPIIINYNNINPLNEVIQSIIDERNCIFIIKFIFFKGYKIKV